MKVIKWCSIFAVGFGVSWILIFTFTQEPFKAAAPAKVFWYSTPEYPIYAYVAITFGVGLLLGFFTAAYYYIRGQAGIHNKKKEIRRLEDELMHMKIEIDRLNKHAGKAKEKITETIKSINDGKEHL